jgi:hypothetical protein
MRRRDRRTSQHVAQGNDGDLIDRRDRTLRRRVVGADRFDRVADELQPDRVRGARRKDVHDPATDRELAVFVGWVFAGEPGIDEQVGEIGRCDVLPGSEVERRRQESQGSGHTRQERRRRRHHDPRCPARDRVQGSCADRRDADVRRQPAIRIDFVRREGQNPRFGRGRR